MPTEFYIFFNMQWITLKYLIDYALSILPDSHLFYFVLQVVVFLFNQQKKERMKRNTFSFIVAILIISQVIASIYVYQKTPLPHPMKCSWYVKCPLSVCHRTFYQSWFSIPVMQLYNKKNGFSLKWCVTDHVIALDICISYYLIKSLI